MCLGQFLIESIKEQKKERPPTPRKNPESKDKEIIKILASELAHRAKCCPQDLAQQPFCNGECEHTGDFGSFVRDCWIAWVIEKERK